MLFTAAATSTELRSTVASANGFRSCCESASVAVEPGLAVGVVLVEDRDLLQVQVGELLHDQRGLVVVRGAQVEHVLLEGFAQRHGAGERRNERHLVLHRERQRRHAGGRADVAEQGEHVFVDQLLRVGSAALGLVAVVQVLDDHLAAAGLGVVLVQEQLGALVELDAKLRCRAGEGCRLAQHERRVALCPGQLETTQRGRTRGQ